MTAKLKWFVCVIGTLSNVNIQFNDMMRITEMSMEKTVNLNNPIARAGLFPTLYFLVTV